MAAKKISFLLFELENQIFTIDVKSVIKIQEIEKITPIPSSPEHLLGLIENVGKSIPLLNLKHIFNFKNTKKQINIAVLSSLNLNNEQFDFAIAVDEVKDIIHIDENEIKEVPKLHYNINLDYLSGLIKVDNYLAYILKIDKILHITEQEQLKEIINSNKEMNNKN